MSATNVRIVMKVKIHLILTALILLTLGIICVLNPFKSFQAVAWLIGLLILCSGIISLLFGLKAQAILPNAASTTLMSLFQITIGAIFMLNSRIAEGSLIVVFAVWMMFESINILVGAFDYRKAGYQQWWLMLILGLISIALSLYAICNPAVTTVAITALLGLGLMSIGMVRLAAIPAVSRLQKRIKEVKQGVEDFKEDVRAIREELHTQDADATEVKE